MTMARPYRTAAANYLRSGEVAELMGISPKTVSRYANEGRLPFQRTLGGHRRYPAAEVMALVAELTYRTEGAAAP
jgi:excisionase family DNA binding protein